MRFSSILKGFSASCALVAGLAMSHAMAAEVTLRYSNWLPTNYHLHTDVMLPWIADVERVTEGRVKVEVLPKVVGSVNGQYDVAADGLADVILFPVAYAPGRFPLEDGLELPFLGDDPVKRSVAAWRAYEKHLKPLGLFKEVHVISVQSSNTAHIMTVSKPVKTIDDLRGMKIRSPSQAATQQIELLGAVPVSKPLSELYELLSGGVVDGCMLPIDVVKGFKLEGALKHITVIEGGVANSHNLIAMNPAAWAKISEADQKAISEISGEYLARRNGEVIGKKLEESYRELREAGVTIEEASPELLAAMKEKVQPVIDAWIAKAKEEGMADPEAFLKELSEASGGTY